MHFMSQRQEALPDASFGLGRSPAQDATVRPQ